MAGLHLSIDGVPPNTYRTALQRTIHERDLEIAALQGEVAYLREEVARLRDALERHALSLVPDEPGRH